MRCGNCGYLFAVDPKTHPQLSDNKIKRLIERVSAGQTLFFTTDQLYAALLSRVFFRARTRAGLFIAAGSALLVVLLSMSHGIWGGALFAGVVALVLLLLAVVGRGRAVPRERFDAAVRRYAAAHGPLEKHLVLPGLHEPPPSWPEPDIYDYGAEAILVVDRDLLVDLLVSNGFHATARAIIVAESGYPGYVAQRAGELVAAPAETPILLLHDAGPGEPSMAERLRRRPPFPMEAARVVDLGLGEQDVERVPLLRRLRAVSGVETVPLDFLPYGTLTPALSLAIESRTPLHQHLEARDVGPGDFG